MRKHFRIFFYFIVALAMFSCNKKQGNKYRYSHYPNGSYVPNSRYYSKPYELFPRGYGDYDQYYVFPYGYSQKDNDYSPVAR